MQIAAEIGIADIPITDKKLAIIKTAQEEDPVCRMVMQYCKGKEQWPETRNLLPVLKPYYQVREEISLMDGLLLREGRIIIPDKLQPDILRRIHAGHLGVEKCRWRARNSVWFPGISSHIEQLTKNCTICAQNSAQTKEPLSPSIIPHRPWETIGSDLFHFQGNNYMVVVDYFSNWIECVRLNNATNKSMLSFLSYLVSRYGHFNEIRTDNGPCYAAANMTQFCSDITARQVTSSPRYAQSNGKAEAAVKICKMLLKKNEANLQFAILTHNSSPMSSGFTPAELFLGRRLNTNLPMHPSKLEPAWPNLEKHRQNAQNRQDKQTKWYNKRHRAKSLTTLVPGDHVYIRQGKHTEKGKVVRQDRTPRSYWVQTQNGVVRRNRSMLIKPRKQPVFDMEQIEEDGPDMPDHITYEQNEAGEEPMETQNYTGRRNMNRGNRGVPPPRLGIST